MPHKRRLNHKVSRSASGLGSLALAAGLVLLCLAGCRALGQVPALSGLSPSPTSLNFSSSAHSLSGSDFIYLPFIKNDKPVLMPLVYNLRPTPTPTPTPTATPIPPGVPPPYSTSYYMSTTDYDTLYSLGETVGRSFAFAEDKIVFLDFGQPWYENNAYGSIIFGSLEFRSIDQIILSVKAFCRGYYVRSSSTAKLTLAIGTSNYGRTYVTREHGAAWAQMVKTLNDWIASPPSWADRIKIAGAIDAEPGWNGPAVTRAWVEGYDAAASGSSYYNFGSCDSCPFDGCETCTPLNGWTYEDLWYVSWGVRSAYILPEIYLVSGVNADQWYRVSRYGYQAHGQGIRFSGVMTQYQSCQQRGCTTNTPSEGWLQLYNRINADPCTAVNPKWLTDIKW